MEIKNKDLKRRIIDLSYPRKLSHLGSALTAVDIIKKIYDIKKPTEKFVLSSGHAHIAHAVVMEQLGLIKDAGENIDKFGIHCEREGGCDCSTGSLGQGLPIAVGMALADEYKDVYCLVSDGELQEGSTHEAAEVMFNEKITNLKVYVNCNGWGAYKSIDFRHLRRRFDSYYDQNISFRNTNCDYLPFLQGQVGHYATMTKDQYDQAMEILS